VSAGNPRSEIFSTRMCRFLAVGRKLGVFLLATAAFSTQAEPFSVQKEFPNYFLPAEYRQVPPDQVPPTVADKAVEQINRALNSIFHRLTIPVVPAGEKHPRMVRYFEYLQAELSKTDPKVEVLPSGGVVRSAIGYLYAEILEGMSGQPPLSPEQVLKKIIEDTEDIAGHKIRGVGSDFDVLLKHSGTHFRSLQKQAAEITNSAETLYEARQFAGGLKRSLFTVGDVKDYEEQTRRSTSQGGAAVDFLAFDLKKRQTLEPHGYQGILQDLVRGWYRYLPPESDEKVEDAAKQTIRGIRPLIELPFLTLADETQLRAEFENIRKSLSEGKRPSGKALEQFEKAVRNARFSGAHNRFHRGEKGSLEDFISEVLNSLEAKTNRSTIPEFVDAFPVDQRTPTNRDLRGFPEHLLMGMDDFIKRHTDAGKLYHGTPNIENGLAVLRGGLFISKDGGRIKGTGITTAVFGRGGYSSGTKSTALGYAGTDGIVFELPVAQDKPLNILDWESVKNSPEIVALKRKAEAEGRDIFALLARDHGIDIIVNHHVLIQNLNAVELPQDIRSIIHAYGSVMENPHATPDARIRAFSMYRQLHSYAEALGEKNVRTAPSLDQFQRWLLTQSEQKAIAIGALLNHPQYGTATLDDLRKSPDKFQLWQKALEEGFASSEEPVRKAVVRQVFKYLDPKDPRNNSLLRRTVQHVSEQSATENEPLLSILKNEYDLGRNIEAIEKYAQDHSAPSQFGELALWLEKTYHNPKLPAPLRLSALRFHALIRPMAYFSEPAVESLEDVSEADFVKMAFQDSTDTLSPFKMVLMDSSLEESWAEQIRDDLALRSRFRTALSNGLGNRSTANDAVYLINHYLPDSASADLELHRRSLLTSIDQFQEPDTKRLDHFYENPKAIEKIFFSDNPKFTVFLPAVEHLLRNDYSPRIKLEILTQLLDRHSELVKLHPDWERKIPEILSKLPAQFDSYSLQTPLAQKEFSKALRRHSPELWTELAQKAVVAGANAYLEWDASDPVQRKALGQLMKRSNPKELAELWKELEARHPKLATQISYQLWEQIEDLDMRSAIQDTPNVPIKPRLLRAAEIAYQAKQAAYSYEKILRTADERTQREIVREWFSTDPPSGIDPVFVHALGSNPKLSQNFIRHLQKSQHPDTFVLTFQLLEDSRFPELSAAIKKNKKWKQRLHSYLMNTPHPLWINYPFNFKSAEDQELLRKYFQGSFPFQSLRERELHEKIRKDFAKELKSQNIPKSVRSIIDEQFGSYQKQIDTPRDLLDKEASELTSAEKARLRKALQRPISEIEYFLLSAMERETGLFGLAVERLKNLTKKDTAFALLDLLESLDRTRSWMASKVWNLLKNDTAFLKSFHEALRAELPQNPKLLEKMWVYPWSAERAEDWQTAKTIAEVYPDVSNELLKTLSGLERKYGRILDYYPWEKLHEIRIDEIRKNRVTSPQDWDRLIGLIESNKRYFKVNQVLNRLAGEDSLEFKSNFPKHPSTRLPKPTSNYWTSGNHIANIFYNHPQVNALLQRIHDGSMEKADARLVRHFFDQRDSNFFLALISNSDRSAAEAMRWLSRREARPMLLKLLEATKVQDAVDKHPELRKDLLADLRQQPTKEKVFSFPWNLENPVEAQLLLSFKPTYWSEDSEAFLEHLADRQPGAFSRVFATSKTLTEYVARAQHRENPEWKVTQRYAELGLKALSPEEQNAMHELFSRPLHLGTAHALTAMLETGSGPLSKIVKRLKNPLPLDQPIGIFAVLNTLQEKSKINFRRLKKHLDWNRLRHELFEAPAEATTEQQRRWIRDAAGNYPWDPADPEDIQLLKKLSTVDPLENARQVRETELQLKQTKMNAQLRSTLEERLLALNHQGYLHHAIESALFAVAIAKPKQFVEAFPHLPLPAIEFYSHNRSSPSLHVIEPVRSLLEKMAQGGVLTKEEQQIKQWYLQKNDLGLLAWMLLQPNTRNEALEVVTKQDPTLALRLVTTEGPDWFTEKSKFLEDVAKRPEWVEKMVPFVDSTAFPLPVWQSLVGDVPKDSELWVAIQRKMAIYQGRPSHTVSAFWKRLEESHGIKAPEKGETLSVMDIPPQHRDAYGKLPLFNPYASSNSRPQKDLLDCGRTLKKLAQRKYWSLPDLSE
jgi:hypothetical protein